MIQTRWLGAAAALSILTLAACDVTTKEGQAPASGEQKAAADKLSVIEMNAYTIYLTDEEREVANLLIQAADLMQPIYLRQASADNVRIREEIAAKGNSEQLAKFDGERWVNFGEIYDASKK